MAILVLGCGRTVTNMMVTVDGLRHCGAFYLMNNRLTCIKSDCCKKGLEL